MPVTAEAYKMIETFYGKTFARRFFFVYSSVTHYQPRHVD
jgi:hypothetical protein